MVPFGGWDMPLSYGDGTIAEHRACRTGAVAFDVSHLGTVRVTGPEAKGVLQANLTADLDKIEPGRTQYTHLLDADDASVLDDIIVWWLGEDRFDVMPNASNTAGVVAAIGGVDVTPTRAIIAVQGPRARDLFPAIADVGRRRVVEMDLDGVAVTVAGTGYTGEDGVEVAVPAEHAAAVWDAVLACGVSPAGPGRPGHTASGGGPAPPRSRAGPGHHPAAGGVGLGRGLGQGRLPGAGGAGGRASRGPEPPPAGPAAGRQAPAPCGPVGGRR